MANAMSVSGVVAVIGVSGVAGALAVVPAYAQTSPAPAQQFAYCLVCHGSDFGGNVAIAAPNLTQLQPWYLEAQLNAFALGYRATHPEDHAARSMASAVRRLMAEDNLVEAVAFVDSYPPRISPATLALAEVAPLGGGTPAVIAAVAESLAEGGAEGGTEGGTPALTAGDPVRGESLYVSCAACHGRDGAGSETIRAPSLLGLNDWYQVKQLLDYRAGHRGVHPDDTYGRSMRAAALQLPGEQAVYDVVAYVQSLAGASATEMPMVASAMRSVAAALPPTIGASRIPAPEPVNAASSIGTDDGPGSLPQPDSEVSTPMATSPRSSRLRSTLPALALAATTSSVLAHDVTRYPLPGGSTFPIAQAVSVPAGTELLFHSGLLPAPADPEAEQGSRAYYGDTYTQTLSVLQRFEASLKEKGLGLGNIIKMNVFLVGDPEMDGKMDFGGFMKAYSQFFGTAEQPHLPARAAVQVAGLANGALVEIEVIAAR